MIAKRIKELRKERNLSQKELAQALNVTQGIISQWESGNFEPQASNIVALADFFNVCADYLLGRQDWY